MTCARVGQSRQSNPRLQARRTAALFGSLGVTRRRPLNRNVGRPVVELWRHGVWRQRGSRHGEAHRPHWVGAKLMEVTGCVSEDRGSIRAWHSY